jgi:peptidoglycan/xylan/chitin deacetylase (PgdA/CDA1 family)
MKRMAKRVVNEAMANIAPMVWRWNRTPRLLVLMYHRVLPIGHPEREIEQPGMYVSPETLRMHLDTLRHLNFDLVHLDDWLDSAKQGCVLPRRACALTFDDGWRDNHQYAYPALKHAGAPATIYLVSDLVGEHYSFWPNGLARALSSQGQLARERIPPWLAEMVQASGGWPKKWSGAQIDSLIAACKGRTDAEMHAVVAELQVRDSPARKERDLMNWNEILEMQASGSVRFGSHTRRHTRLASVTSELVIRDEVVNSRDLLQEKLGRAPRTFCYPNGDVSPLAAGIVRSAYAAAVTTTPGWYVSSADPFLIPRIGMHEDASNTSSAFTARIGNWI